MNAKLKIALGTIAWYAVLVMFANHRYREDMTSVSKNVVKQKKKK